MCRYASKPYKAHYACFGCRKQFKRRNAFDIDYTGPQKPAKCPDCGVLMANMGLDFAPPPRRAEKEWRQLESLWTLGITFHSCGCGGPGYRPRGPTEYLAFLRDMKAEYQTKLAFYEETTPLGWNPSQCADAREHWASRVAAIDAAIREASG